MKVLVLGAAGMLGHRLTQELSRQHEIVATLRGSCDGLALPTSDSIRYIEHVDALDEHQVPSLLEVHRPEVVLNAVGVVKQRTEAHDIVGLIKANAILPHRLARVASDVGARLVHFSTDCVFSGKTGRYSEDDQPDPSDAYGMTKLLGEVDSPGCVTIRTSLIGLELGTAHGLIEWALAQSKISGYRRAIFSGLTTSAVASLVSEHLLERPVAGVWHVSAMPISKFDLLTRFLRAIGSSVCVEPDDSVHCDRSLDSTRFEAELGWSAPSWEEMLGGLADEVANRAAR